MDWLLILTIAAQGGAVASTATAMLFGYRAATFTIDERTAEADMRRQSDYVSYTGAASALAAASFVAALLSI